MEIKVFNNNRMMQNVYLYYDKNVGNGFLIDAGCSKADMKAIAAFISENSITVKGILLTHGHYDHIIAVDEVKSLTSAVVCSHEIEKQMLENPEVNLSVYSGLSATVIPEKLFNDGDIFQVGESSLKVLHTPGHTPGGVCYYDEENGNLFAGDTLFQESVGRTDFPLGNHSGLIKSIAEKLFTLPDSTKVYPGHGASTTIGHEKQYNPFVKC